MLPSPSFGGKNFFLSIKYVGIVFLEEANRHRNNHACLIEAKGGIYRVNEFVTD